MPYELVGVSGANKGLQWEIGEESLVLGRGEECDIVIPEKVVSRKHCLLRVSGEELCFVDMGSRNPALVNGVPLQEGLLSAGDTLALGNEVFLVVERTNGSFHKSSVKVDAETVSVGRGEPLQITVNADFGVDADEVTRPAGRPQTVHDLVSLHEMLRDLAQARCMRDLVDLLVARLSSRLSPQRLWIALVHGTGCPGEHAGLTFYVPEALDGSPGPGAPADAIARALREQRGLLCSRNERANGQLARVSTIVAPVRLAGRDIAVLAAETRTPDGVFGEDEIRFLVLFAQAAAPFFHAVERLEQLERDNERLRIRAGESIVLVGESRNIRHVRAQVAKAAASGLNVLITGETGTGKELVARMLHAQSPRNAGPFVVVNCAAIPQDLFESTFFGYEKGAFTGAAEASPGLLAQAHGGTLFLDEAGDLSLGNQARILRAVEYGAFMRIGARQETYADIRTVAATNKDLPAEMARGAFREDLYQRLNGFHIAVPCLRERPSDIPVLAGHFFEMFRSQAKRTLTGIDDAAMNHLCKRRWPGNVRELRNCIQRAIAIAASDAVRLEDVYEPGGTPAHGPAQQAVLTLAEAEKQHISSVLEQCHGDVRDAAHMLGVGVSTLYKKLAKLGISY